jgi:hypothetical protein
VVVSGIPAAATGRLDQLVLSSSGYVTRLAGTTDSGAVTLDNRTGAVPLTADMESMRICDMLVKSTGIAAADIRDRRPWARGFNFAAADPNTADPTINAAAFANPYPSGNYLKVRVECGAGNMLIVALLNAGFYVNTASTTLRVGVAYDGALDTFRVPQRGIGTLTTEVPFFWIGGPAAGSHLIEIQMKNDGGNTLKFASAGGFGATPSYFMVEERLKQSAYNGIV